MTPGRLRPLSRDRREARIQSREVGAREAADGSGRAIAHARVLAAEAPVVGVHEEPALRHGQWRRTAVGAQQQVAAVGVVAAGRQREPAVAEAAAGTQVGRQRVAVDRLLQDHVDHAGQRVAAVHRRGTHRHDLDALDGRRRNQVQVEEVGRRRPHRLEPASVDQNQRGAERQAAQLHGPLPQRRAEPAFARGGRHLVEPRQKALQVRLPALLDVLAGVDIHRRRSLRRDALQARAGDLDLRHRRRVVARGVDGGGHDARGVFLLGLRRSRRGGNGARARRASRRRGPHDDRAVLHQVGGQARALQRRRDGLERRKLPRHRMRHPTLDDRRVEQHRRARLAGDGLEQFGHWPGRLLDRVLRRSRGVGRLADTAAREQRDQDHGNHARPVRT